VSDTRSIIEASIANIREDGPGDGGPEPLASPDTPDIDTSDAPADPVDAPEPAEGDTPAVPEPVSETPATPEPPKEEKPAADNEDFDTEPEFTQDKNGRKIVNRIPQPRVKKMVERAVAKATEAKEREFTEKVSIFEQQIKGYEDLGEIMATDDGRFMQMLAQAYPAYRKYVEGGAAQPAVKTPAPGADDPMPPPDARLADGTPAYSPEGFQKVQDWQARQIEQRVLGQVNEKYGWVDQERQAREREQAAVPVVRAQLQEAMQHWDGFADSADEILAELRSDSEAAARTGRPPKLSLHDAYRVVMNRKIKAEREAWQKERESLKTDRNKTREEVLKEIQGRPSSTATVPTTPTVRPDADAPRDSKEIIRQAMAGLRRTA